MRKHLLVAVAATVAALLTVLGGFASADVTPVPTTPAPTGVTDTISIEDSKGALKFVAPATVQQGDELKIVNETDPKKGGPHTFSLVTPGSVPKTAAARKSCFTPKHICLAIAKWQGFTKDEKITINPAEAGPEGWSTAGSTSVKGDSWFTGKKGQSFSQAVTAAPGTIHFLCAVHPWMHGQVKVLPGS